MDPRQKYAPDVAAGSSSKSSSPGILPNGSNQTKHAADLFMSRFDGATRPAVAHLLRASAFLSGRAGPEKLLELARSPKLSAAIATLQRAIVEDPRGARAKAIEVLDEIANPALKQERRVGYANAGMAARPPSEKQLAFLKDLGHPNPRALRTAAEAHAEIQRRLPQQGGRR